MSGGFSICLKNRLIRARYISNQILYPNSYLERFNQTWRIQVLNWYLLKKFRTNKRNHKIDFLNTCNYICCFNDILILVTIYVILLLNNWSAFVWSIIPLHFAELETTIIVKIFLFSFLIISSAIAIVATIYSKVSHYDLH